MRSSHRPRDFRLQSLESRKLLASVAPGLATDVSYGGSITNGTAMEFSPDGRLWVLRQNGEVRVIQRNATTSTAALVFSTANGNPVDSSGERGLLGIAFDPNFGNTNNYVYLYRTIPSSAGGPYNRIARFTVNGDTIDPTSEAVIMNLNALSGATNHNGGAIHFGPDGKLYVAVGENASSANSQVVTNRLGKMLRLNPDPNNPIPSDNPATFTVRQSGNNVVVTPTGDNKAIWAVGLRNPFTFAFDPTTGRMHINDVGASSWEEVNVGASGANYGWNTTEGNFNQATYPAFTLPLHTYSSQDGNPESAITGGTFYNPDYNQFGAQYAGDYFFADLSGNWIRTLDASNAFAFVDTGGVSNGPNTVQSASTVVDIKVDDVGAVYYLQRSGSQGVRVVRSATPQVVSDRFEFDSEVPTDPAHSIQFRFTYDVSASLSVDDLTVVNTTTNTTILGEHFELTNYDPGTNIATFAYDGILPDGDYTATLDGTGITNIAQTPLGNDYVAEFFVLAGDLNRDRKVDFEDLLVVAQNYDESGQTFTGGNVDYSDDGKVDFSDLLIVAQHYGIDLDNAARVAPIKPRPVVTPMRVRDD
ncbi:MAG TPA: PQQ-dependent sugar dehydrogenase, partial [Tepidisphaeraceae bacterium]|nr:PQQ-dependent sugar dehydrogenase [Tepidisphaeraceae bacterium]